MTDSSPTEARADGSMLRAMSLGFGAGSVLFATGAALSWSDTSALSASIAYFAGAVLFTFAALVQWRAAVQHHPRVRTHRIAAEFALGNSDWAASVVQFVGTLFFNIMTIRALALLEGSARLSYSSVWRPDVFGSTLFLVASILAWRPVARRQRHRLLAGRSRWICLLNLAGSLFFGVSAVGSLQLSDGQLLSDWWTNAGTLLGAICFLSASLLLWPWSVRIRALAEFVELRK